MSGFYIKEMNGERKTQLDPQELEDEFDEEDDYFQPEDDWEDEYNDDEYERDYCD